MRRKIAHSPAASIQLFPFLAVLISTMGALVVLLFAFAKHGQNQAEKAAQVQTVGQASEEAESAGEVLAWQLTQLQTSRDKTNQQLTDRRAELSHVEEHLRRLRAQAEELELAIGQLDAAKSNVERDPTQLEQQRQRTLQQIDDLQRQLEDRQQRRQSQPVTYSVVPYHGPNSTSRRPIYIECTSESVIVQPEGLVLGEADFQPPLGPGNPLAAAIRAYGEYLNKAGFTAEQTKPYPMLLVRPDGIEAYYAARSALVSWGTEFGYELVGQDWALEFPESDARLATTLQDVVAEARIRQQALAAAAPRQFARSRSSGGLRASANGRGFVREGGDFDEPSQRGFGRTAGQGSGRSGFGGTAAAGGNGTGTPGSPGGASNSTGESSTYGEPGALATGVNGSVNNGFGTPGTSAAAIPGNSSAFGSQATAGNPYGASGQPGSGEPGTGDPGTGEPGTGEPGALATGVSGGANSGPNGGETGDRYSQSSGSSGQAGGQPGGQSGGQSGDSANQSSMAGNPSGAASASAGGNSSAAASGASPGGAGGSSGGEQQSSNGLPQVPLTAPRNTPNSVASRRGEDWGLPDASRGLIPVTRPVIVRCEADRLVILPDDDRTDPRPIALPDRSEAAVDELVSSVWDHIKSWGTAGRGMYWRPMLVFDVAPGGEARYAEFQSLLAGSGMEVKQRTRTAAQPAGQPSRRR